MINCVCSKLLSSSFFKTEPVWSLTFRNGHHYQRVHKGTSWLINMLRNIPNNLSSRVSHSLRNLRLRCFYKNLFLQVNAVRETILLLSIYLHTYWATVFISGRANKNFSSNRAFGYHHHLTFTCPTTTIHLRYPRKPSRTFAVQFASRSPFKVRTTAPQLSPPERVLSSHIPTITIYETLGYYAHGKW